jgi:hypothetical protein
VPDTTTWIALGAFGVAAYGAVLSTYNGIVHHRERQEELTRDVLVTSNVAPDPTDMTKAIYSITAVNKAIRPVEVKKVGVVVATGFCVFHWPEPANLPARLEDGQSVTVEIEERWLDLVRDSTRQEIIGLAVMDSHEEIYQSPLPWLDEAGVEPEVE